MVKLAALIPYVAVLSVAFASSAFRCVPLRLPKGQVCVKRVVWLRPGWDMLNPRPLFRIVY